MRRVLTAAVLVPLVLLIVFKGSLAVLTIACAVVAGLAAWEFLALADASGAKTPRVSVLVAIAILFVCTFLRPEYTAAVIGALSFLLLIVCTFRRTLRSQSKPVSADDAAAESNKLVLLDTGSSIFALVYCGLSLTALPLISTQEHGPSLLAFLFCAVWVGDVAALYVGRNLGRHKLAPSLSPNKTWEGSIASVAGSLLVTGVLIGLAAKLAQHGLDYLAYPGSITRWMGLAVLVNVAAQIGDLVESAIKRGAGVKDSGTLLPGHGGMLDRIDALLLAAPVLWYALLVQGAF